MAESSMFDSVKTLIEEHTAVQEELSDPAVHADAARAKRVNRRYAELSKILKDPEVQERLAKLGLDPSGMPPAELAAFQKSEIEKWAKVVKAANIRID